MTRRLRICLVDNRDSFVYNLVDALSDHDCHVFRNTVSPDEMLASEPDLICLSPGPGHPRDAGTLMEVVRRAYGVVPLFGICLGFQAILEHTGGDVRPCGPVHGQATSLTVVDHPVFRGLSPRVARYHSLGSTDAPGLTPLATTATAIGDVVMAAEAPRVFGVQFHPESILTPDGPVMIQRIITRLTTADAADDQPLPPTPSERNHR